MKKIIFTLAILVCSLVANAQSRMNVWYVSSPTVTAGSQQWVDVKYLGDFTLRASFGINVLNEEKTANIASQELFTISYEELEALPKNGDGTTRLYFTIPSNLPSGPGEYYCDTQTPRSEITVISSTTTSVIEPMESTKPGTVFFYNKNGILIKECRIGEELNLSGHFIYKILYDDKTFHSGQIYINY